MPQTRLPRHVCLATDSREPSGVGQHLLDLAAAAVGAGIRVTVLAHESTPLLARAAALGCGVAPLSDDDAVALPLGIDLLHVHAGIGWEGHGLTRAGAAAGVPVLRSEHLPWLLTDAEQVAEYRETVPLVHRVLAVSDGVAASFRDAGVPSEQLVVVRNGARTPDVVRSPAEVRGELGATGPVLLHVGRFAPQKRHDLLLAAFADVADRHPDAILVLVGAGPDEAQARAAAAELGVADRVRFLGRRGDVGDLMAAADVFVLPSDFEGHPLVLLEAMGMGLPVVATDVVGTRDAVDATCARLVPAADAAALAVALDAALADPDDMRRLAEAARARHTERFTPAHMAAATLDLYRSIQEDHPMTRIGFIGAGGIARRHQGVLAQLPEARIVAVTDADADRARDFAADCGAEAVADVEAVLAAGVDCVFICVPPFAHGEPELACARAQVPFFVEKPVALDLALAEQIRDAAEGLVTGVGYHWRYLDGLDRVREVTDTRPPRLASGFWLDSTPPVGWWVRQDLSGGQATEQLTHLVDISRVLLGDARTVFALAETTPREQFPDLDVATSTTAAIGFAGGCTASFQCTCLLGWNHRVELQLYGDGYAIELTDHDVMVDVGAGRPRFGNETDPVLVQDRTFLEAVAGGENRIRCTYADAVETLRTTLAITESAGSGRAVTLAEENR